MTYHALQFDLIPGFADLPDAVLEAERLSLGREAAVIASNAAFGMVRLEMFQGQYADGEIVPLPISSVDGYRYSRNELTYIWSIAHTANRETNWMTGPDCLWYAAWLVNQNTGLVSCAEYYRRSGSHADPATSNDGVLQVFTVAQRSKATLAMSDIARFDVAQLSDFSTDDSWTEERAIRLNHQAKFAAVKSEAIYMGEFVNGDQVPKPVSPVDGYEYDYSEVTFLWSWRWTCKSSAFGQPDMALGQLGPIKADIDLTGNVDCVVTMYNNGLLPQTTFGRLSVVAITKRMTTYFRLDARTMPWSFAGGINSSFPIVDDNGLEPLVCESLNITASDILSISASASRNVNAIRRGATGHDSGPGGNTDTFPGGKTPPSTYNDPSWDLFNLPGCIIGAFTDDDGNVIMVFGLGTGTPSTITVPVGATKLNLGINDVAYAANTGYFIVQIGGMSALDNFTEQDLNQFMPGEVLKASAVSTINRNALEASHAVENFGPFVLHDGDTVALPVSFFDGYGYSRAELSYIWEWNDTTPDTGTHLRVPLFGAHIIPETGVAVVKPYRLADGGPVVAGGSGFGSIRVCVLGVRQSVIQTFTPTTDNPPGDVGSIPADLPGGVELQVEDVDCGIQTIANFKSANANLTITDLGDGSIEFDAATQGGGGGGSDMSTRRRTFKLNGSRYAFTSFASGAAGWGEGIEIIINGSPAGLVAPDATHGTGVEFSSSSQDLAGLRAYSSTETQYAMGLNLALLCSMYIKRITDVRMWIGLNNSMGGGTSGAFGSSDSFVGGSLAGQSFIGFRFSSVAGDANWKCVTADGSGETVTDSGVTADTKSHRFAFIVDDSVPNVKFYIDGVLVATVTTTLPASGTTFGHILGSAYISSSGAHPVFGYLEIEADF